MLERGDWVVPYFNGEIRTHKPVLLYWFMMSAYAVFGINEFSARFWSAFLGVGTVLLTYGIGVRLLGRRRGLLSGLALSSMLMFVVASRAATPDAVLIFFLTASLAVYVGCTPAFGKPIRIENPFSCRTSDSMDAPDSRRKDFSTNHHRDLFPSDLPAVVLMYALMGLASLGKGPVGFLLPTAIIGMYLLIRRAPTVPAQGEGRRNKLARTLRQVLVVIHPLHFVRTCASMRLGWMIVSVLVVALPWYIWVTVRSDGEWTRGFFLEHNVGRAVNAMENHRGGPVFYLVAFLVGTFPLSIFFPSCADRFNETHSVLRDQSIGRYRRQRNGKFGQGRSACSSQRVCLSCVLDLGDCRAVHHREHKVAKLHYALLSRSRATVWQLSRSPFPISGDDVLALCFIRLFGVRWYRHCLCDPHGSDGICAERDAASLDRGRLGHRSVRGDGRMEPTAFRSDRSDGARHWLHIHPSAVRLGSRPG